MPHRVMRGRESILGEAIGGGELKDNTSGLQCICVG